MAFPFRPDIRANSLQVGKGQQEKHFQRLCHLHGIGKVLNQSDIIQVSSLRDVSHVKMVANQEFKTMAGFFRKI